MAALYQSITELVGQTPIIKLHHFTSDQDADIYVKLESFNPGSSVKDRIALAMIEAAEADGTLKPGDAIIEPTSGNTGIGLAWVGAAKGYPVVIVMPETMSKERRQLIQAYGAELVLTPGEQGMKGAIAKAHELAQKRGGWVPLQFNNPANPKIHETTTGKEIAEAFTNIGLDAFVAGVGTGGTISGVSHVLKETFPNIQIVAVEADESAVLSGQEPGPHKIQGISAGFIPETLDTKAYDAITRVKSQDALLTARQVGHKEGFLVGISSGAALYAAIELAQKLGKGKKVLALLPDNGERYLTTELYQAD
ncbi:cysteine synthase A [Streptococcus halichoeri]|uniref:cysteine synthase A n=1 Tax=Streptococcus halichoeri TaxID=254785 RepID=UPI001358EE2F|nr:cysteine synthase A [Streptococcus halichoeri]